MYCTIAKLLSKISFHRVTDLETALVESCDFGTIRNICKCRTVPEHLRAEVWQVMIVIFLTVKLLRSLQRLVEFIKLEKTYN